LTAVPHGARNFVRRVAGSLREAAQKLNPINRRVCAKTESRFQFGNLRKGMLPPRVDSSESGQVRVASDAVAEKLGYVYILYSRIENIL
jgi:hypothetical protein